MARCKECIHYEICAKEGRLAQIDEHTWNDYNQLDDVERFCNNYISTTDVAPKSEVAREMFDKIGHAMCDTYNMAQAEAHDWHMYGDTDKYPLAGWEKGSYLQGMKRMIDVIRDLKKKYTEGERE